MTDFLNATFQNQAPAPTPGDLVAELPLHVDSTMLTCFRSCRRKWYNEFVLGCRPVGLSIDLHAGAVFALTIEHIYKRLWLSGCSLPDAIAYGAGVFFANWGDVEPPPHKRSPKTKDRVWAAIEDYCNHYGGRTDHVAPYFDASGKPTFEYTFAIPLEPASDKRKDWQGCDDGGFPLHPVKRTPFLYSGRFDLLGSYMGRPCVRDEKTTTSIGDRWADQWNLRNQFMGYKWACNTCGIPVRDTVIRGVGILKTEIKQVEAIRDYSDFLIARWYEQLRRDLWRMVDCWNENYFDYNFGDACTQYGNCVFMDVCQSPNTESFLSRFHVSRWNPLEKNPVVAPTLAESPT